MAGLELEGVSHRYGDFFAVREVDLAVRPGETVCLLGPSGCGKSTLLRLAAGLETLATGQIRIGGRTAAEGGGPAGRRVHVPPEARGVGLMFQDYALFPHLTVLENVRYGLSGGRGRRRGGREGEGEAAAARRALSELGMAEHAGRYPHALSGGQQQRVALLRALAPRPGVMLLDEPFSTLDEHLRHEVRMETMGLLAGGGAATVIVTHDAEEAMLLSDRIVVMREGRIVQDAAPGEVYARPADPFVARLFGPVNRYRGTVRGGRVATPLGAVPAAGLPEGSEAEVVVRADGIALGPPAEAAGARAQVRSVRRLGPSTLAVAAPLDESTAEAAGGGRPSPPPILVRLPGAVEVEEGDRVSLRPDPGHCFVFPAGGRRRIAACYDGVSSSKPQEP